MATETLDKAVVEKSEPLFSKKNKRLLTNPMDTDNPITVQVLGICSALAVTVAMIPTLYMCAGVLFVMVMSSTIISMMRNIIPARIKIIVQLVIVAFMVIIVSEVLKAFAYDVSKQLSVFVGLIVTNCIVMGRLEAFALANKPWPSFLDAVGNAMGYAAILIIVSFFRELIGSGKLFGVEVFSAMGLDYTPNGVFIFPMGACFVVGLLIWAQRARNGYTESN